jgi:DNA anti-recombination protein RmuC
MPVTIRLSTLLTQRLGEQAADELANWFNQVDATYRADLRELIDVHFARFDAKLEQRLAETTARLDARIDSLEARLDAKIDRVANELDAKIDRVANELNAKIDRAANELNAKIDRTIADLRAELIKWMFLFWVGSVVTIVGAMSVLR